MSEHYMYYDPNWYACMQRSSSRMWKNNYCIPNAFSKLVNSAKMLDQLAIAQIYSVNDMANGFWLCSLI